MEKPKAHSAQYVDADPAHSCRIHPGVSSTSLKGKKNPPSKEYSLGEINWVRTERTSEQGSLTACVLKCTYFRGCTAASAPALQQSCSGTAPQMECSSSSCLTQPFSLQLISEGLWGLLWWRSSPRNSPYNEPNRTLLNNSFFLFTIISPPQVLSVLKEPQRCSSALYCERSKSPGSSVQKTT